MFSSKNLVKSVKATGITLALSGMTVTVQAAVNLLVDDHIKVTAINGQELKQSLFQPLKKQFSLQPGRHVITAKYDRLYDLRHDEHDYLRSGNISVTAELQDNQTYRLIMPNQPEDYQQAKEYVKKPTLAIEQDSKIIAKQSGIQTGQDGLFSGITNTIGGMLGVKQTAAQQSIPVLEQPSPNNENALTSQAFSSSSSTLDKFMQLWLQANEAEREKIRQWVAK